MESDANINWVSILRIGRKILDAVYGLIGLFVASSMLVRQWQEGAFGNETDIFLLYRYGPLVGFLTIGAGLSLTFGQVLILFNKKSGVWFARIATF